MSTRIIKTVTTSLALLICAALVIVYFAKFPTPLKVPSEQIATSTSLTYSPGAISTSSVELATYRSKTFPLTFQYPKDWIVDDTMGGVTITSYKSDVGASIGTVPEGGFQIDLAPFEKSAESLGVWCRKPFEQDKFNQAMDLVISTTTKLLDRDGNIIAFDFKSRRDSTYNARVVCVEDNNTYIAINGYPLTASQLPLLNIIVDSVKVDHDGQKFRRGS